MSFRQRKILFTDALDMTSTVVLGFPILFWLIAWAQPTWTEVAWIVLGALPLHFILVHTALKLHESRGDVRRFLREFRETGVMPAGLMDMDPRVVRSSLDRWAFTRTAWITMAFFLRDLPCNIYIAEVMVPRLPNPHIGYLFLYVEWATYLATATVLIWIQQKILVARLRRELLEAGFDRGIRDDIWSWRVVQDLGRVEVVLSTVAVMFIVSATYVLLHPGVVGWPEQTEKYGIVVVAAGGAAAISLLWLRQARMRDYLTGKMVDYEREMRWTLDRDIELHRMSSLGQMAGLVMHDLLEQLATMKLASESLARVAGSDDVNARGMKVAVTHMEELLTSMRAKIREQGDVGGLSADLCDCVGYAMTLLRASEGSFVISKWDFKLDPQLRGVRVAMLQTDLVQIMTNLGSNAIRAMRDLDAGVISLHLARREEGFVTLAMSDNGSGLSKARFGQLTAISRLGDDSAQIREGLGLRLVCRMVERAGGKVSVDEESGPGATKIYIKLPLA